MNLREIARQADVLDGQLSLWMMPYLTLRNDVVASAFEKIIPRDQWGNIHQVFIICEGTLVDADIRPDSSEARGFAAYWSGRGRDIGENWELFTTVTGGRVYGAILEAWADTRDAAYDALEELNTALEEDADPEALGG